MIDDFHSSAISKDSVYLSTTASQKSPDTPCASYPFVTASYIKARFKPWAWRVLSAAFFTKPSFSTHFSNYKFVKAFFSFLLKNGKGDDPNPMNRTVRATFAIRLKFSRDQGESMPMWLSGHTTGKNLLLHLPGGGSLLAERRNPL
jgi:hypothetical protein